MKIAKFLKRFTYLTLFFFLFYEICGPSSVHASISRSILPTEVHSTNTFSMSLPEELGTLEYVHAGSGPLLVHIQEAHGQLESEKKIHQILHFLKKQYGVDLVFLEGNAFKLEPDLLRFFPKHKKLNSKILEMLMQKNLVTGPAMFLAEDRDARGYGIEDLSTYIKNGQDFREVISRNDYIQAFLKAVDLQIKRLSAPYLNKDIRSFLKKNEDYEKELLPFVDWMNHLAEKAKNHLQIDLMDPKHQLDWPMLVRMLTLQSFESRIDHSQLMGEKELFLKAIKRWIYPKDKSLFAEVKRFLTSESASRHLGEPDTSILFEKMVSYLPENFAYDTFPQVSLYIGHLILSSEIHADELLEELDRLKSLVAERLCGNQKEKEIVHLFERHRLLMRLFNLELTPADYERVLNDGEPLWPAKIIEDLVELNHQKRVDDTFIGDIGQIEKLYETALRFYEGTKKRDRWMLENIEKHLSETRSDRAVVVTGGFHAQPFQRHFKSKDYNYVLISPKISKINDRNSYLNSVLSNQKEFSSNVQSTFRNIDFPLNLPHQIEANQRSYHDPFARIAGFVYWILRSLGVGLVRANGVMTRTSLLRAVQGQKSFSEIDGQVRLSFEDGPNIVVARPVFNPGAFDGALSLPSDLKRSEVRQKPNKQASKDGEESEQKSWSFDLVRKNFAQTASWKGALGYAMTRVIAPASIVLFSFFILGPAIRVIAFFETYSLWLLAGLGFEIALILNEAGRNEVNQQEESGPKSLSSIFFERFIFVSFAGILVITGIVFEMNQANKWHVMNHAIYHRSLDGYVRNRIMEYGAQHIRIAKPPAGENLIAYFSRERHALVLDDTAPVEAVTHEAVHAYMNRQQAWWHKPGMPQAALTEFDMLIATAEEQPELARAIEGRFTETLLGGSPDWKAIHRKLIIKATEEAVVEYTAQVDKEARRLASLVRRGQLEPDEAKKQLADYVHHFGDDSANWRIHHYYEGKNTVYLDQSPSQSAIDWARRNLLSQIEFGGQPVDQIYQGYHSAPRSEIRSSGDASSDIFPVKQSHALVYLDTQDPSDAWHHLFEHFVHEQDALEEVDISDQEDAIDLLREAFAIAAPQSPGMAEFFVGQLNEKLKIKVVPSSEEHSPALIVNNTDQDFLFANLQEDETPGHAVLYVREDVLDLPVEVRTHLLFLAGQIITVLNSEQKAQIMQLSGVALQQYQSNAQLNALGTSAVVIGVGSTGFGPLGEYAFDLLKPPTYRVNNPGDGYELEFDTSQISGMEEDPLEGPAPGTLKTTPSFKRVLEQASSWQAFRDHVSWQTPAKRNELAGRSTAPRLGFHMNYQSRKYVPRVKGNAYPDEWGDPQMPEMRKYQGRGAPGGVFGVDPIGRFNADVNPGQVLGTKSLTSAERELNIEQVFLDAGFLAPLPLGLVERREDPFLYEGDPTGAVIQGIPLDAGRRLNDEIYMMMDRAVHLANRGETDAAYADLDEVKNIVEKLAKLLRSIHDAGLIHGGSNVNNFSLLSDGEIFIHDLDSAKRKEDLSLEAGILYQIMDIRKMTSTLVQSLLVGVPNFAQEMEDYFLQVYFGTDYSAVGIQYGSNQEMARVLMEDAATTPVSRVNHPLVNLLRQWLSSEGLTPLDITDSDIEDAPRSDSTRRFINERAIAELQRRFTAGHTAELAVINNQLGEADAGILIQDAIRDLQQGDDSQFVSFVDSYGHHVTQRNSPVHRQLLEREAELREWYESKEQSLPLWLAEISESRSEVRMPPTPQAEDLFTTTITVQSPDQSGAIDIFVEAKKVIGYELVRLPSVDGHYQHTQRPRSDPSSGDLFMAQATLQSGPQAAGGVGLIMANMEEGRFDEINFRVGPGWEGSGIMSRIWEQEMPAVLANGTFVDGELANEPSVLELAKVILESDQDLQGDLPNEQLRAEIAQRAEGVESSLPFVYYNLPGGGYPGQEMYAKMRHLLTDLNSQLVGLVAHVILNNDINFPQERIAATPVAKLLARAGVKDFQVEARIVQPGTDDTLPVAAIHLGGTVQRSEVRSAGLAGNARTRALTSLALSRKLGEKIVINGDVILEVTDIDQDGKRVRLAFDAPISADDEQQYWIHRTEVYKKMIPEGGVLLGHKQMHGRSKTLDVKVRLKEKNLGLGLWRESGEEVLGGIARTRNLGDQPDVVKTTLANDVDFKVSVISVQAGKVRLAIQAPPDMRIVRSELLSRELYNQEDVISRVLGRLGAKWAPAQAHPAPPFVVRIAGKIGTGKTTINQRLIERIRLKFAEELEEHRRHVINVPADDFLIPREERKGQRYEEDMIRDVQIALAQGLPVYKYLFNDHDRVRRRVVANHVKILRHRNKEVIREKGRELVFDAKLTAEMRAQGLISPISEVLIDITGGEKEEYDLIERFDPRGNIVMLEGNTSFAFEDIRFKKGIGILVVADEITRSENIKTRVVTGQRTFQGIPYEDSEATFFSMYSDADAADALYREERENARERAAVIFNQSRRLYSARELHDFAKRKLAVLEQNHFSGRVPNAAYELLQPHLKRLSEIGVGRFLHHLPITQVAENREEHLNRIFNHSFLHRVIRDEAPLPVEVSQKQLREKIDDYLDTSYLRSEVRMLTARERSESLARQLPSHFIDSVGKQFNVSVRDMLGYRGLEHMEHPIRVEITNRDGIVEGGALDFDLGKSRITVGFSNEQYFRPIRLHGTKTYRRYTGFQETLVSLALTLAKNAGKSTFVYENARAEDEDLLIPMGFQARDNDLIFYLNSTPIPETPIVYDKSVLAKVISLELPGGMHTVERQWRVSTNPEGGWMPDSVQLDKRDFSTSSATVGVREDLLKAKFLHLSGDPVTKSTPDAKDGSGVQEIDVEIRYNSDREEVFQIQTFGMPDMEVEMFRGILYWIQQLGIRQVSLIVERPYLVQLMEAWRTQAGWRNSGQRIMPENRTRVVGYKDEREDFRQLVIDLDPDTFLLERRRTNRPRSEVRIAEESLKFGFTVGHGLDIWVQAEVMMNRLSLQAFHIDGNQIADPIAEPQKWEYENNTSPLITLSHLAGENHFVIDEPGIVAEEHGYLQIVDGNLYLRDEKGFGLKTMGGLALKPGDWIQMRELPKPIEVDYEEESPWKKIGQGILGLFLGLFLGVAIIATIIALVTWAHGGDAKLKWRWADDVAPVEVPDDKRSEIRSNFVYYPTRFLDVASDDDVNKTMLYAGPGAGFVIDQTGDDRVEGGAHISIRRVLEDNKPYNEKGNRESFAVLKRTIAGLGHIVATGEAENQLPENLELILLKAPETELMRKDYILAMRSGDKLVVFELPYKLKMNPLDLLGELAALNVEQVSRIVPIMRQKNLAHVPYLIDSSRSEVRSDDVAKNHFFVGRNNEIEIKVQRQKNILSFNVFYHTGQKSGQKIGGTMSWTIPEHGSLSLKISSDLGEKHIFIPLPEIVDGLHGYVQYANDTLRVVDPGASGIAGEFKNKLKPYWWHTINLIAESKPLFGDLAPSSQDDEADEKVVVERRKIWKRLFDWAMDDPVSAISYVVIIASLITIAWMTSDFWLPGSDFWGNPEVDRPDLENLPPARSEIRTTTEVGVEVQQTQAVQLERVDFWTVRTRFAGWIMPRPMRNYLSGLTYEDAVHQAIQVREEQLVAKHTTVSKVSTFQKFIQKFKTLRTFFAGANQENDSVEIFDHRTNLDDPSEFVATLLQLQEQPEMTYKLFIDETIDVEAFLNELASTWEVSKRQLQLGHLPSLSRIQNFQLEQVSSDSLTFEIRAQALQARSTGKRVALISQQEGLARAIAETRGVRVLNIYVDSAEYHHAAALSAPEKLDKMTDDMLNGRYQRASELFSLGHLANLLTDLHAMQQELLQAA